MKKLQQVRELQDQSVEGDRNEREECDIFAELVSKKKSGRDDKLFEQFLDGNMSMDEYSVQIKINAKFSKKGRGQKRP